MDEESLDDIILSAEIDSKRLLSVQNKMIEGHNAFIRQYRAPRGIAIKKNREFINAIKNDLNRKKRTDDPYHCYSSNSIDILRRGYSQKLYNDTNGECTTNPAAAAAAYISPPTISTKISFKKEVRRKKANVYVIPKRIRHNLPPKSSFTLVRVNHRVEDDPVLRFLPYFGDEDCEDVVSQLFQLQKVELKGQSAIETEFEALLVDSVLNSVSRMVDIKNDEWVLALAAREFNFPLQLARSRAEILSEKSTKNGRVLTPIKHLANGALSSALQQQPPATATEGVLPTTLEPDLTSYTKFADSYRTLFCRRCYIYDCNIHGAIEKPPLGIQNQKATLRRDLDFCESYATTDDKGDSSTCGSKCYKKKFRISLPGILSSSKLSPSVAALVTRAHYIFMGDYCKIALLFRGMATCSEISSFCKSLTPRKSLVDNIVSRVGIYKEEKRRKHKKKKRRAPSSHMRQSGSQMATAFAPCAHAGPCSSADTCSCVRNKSFCTKHCHCITQDCRHVFSGCRCGAGQCRTKVCPCVAAARECDPDICSCLSDDCCCNRNVANGKHKRLLVGISDIPAAGWGAFSPKKILKDEFVVEYRGELVTQEEAERRGVLYDKQNRSYLFNLDTELVVDALRKGNKARFINHSSTPNVIPRVVLTNSGSHIIGLYAAHDIPAHEELFFDYRYEAEIESDAVFKPAMVAEWMTDANMAGRVSKKYRALTADSSSSIEANASVTVISDSSTTADGTQHMMEY